MLKAWDFIRELKDMLSYDPEESILGDVSRDFYMLLPTRMVIPECPIQNVGKGIEFFMKDADDLIAAIYALAKAQYIKYKNDENEAIKWAVLRVSMFKAGWFDSQSHTKYVVAPPDFKKIFITDGEVMKGLDEQAWQLSSFFPFMNEFYFRSLGSYYCADTAADFSAKAKQFAVSSQMGNILSYFPEDVLFYHAFRWIGVKRPMQVLRADPGNQRIPSAFRTRVNASPCGQAVITSMHAVIQKIISFGYLDEVKKYTHFDYTNLSRVAEKILNDPWKYHMYRDIYEAEALTEAECRDVEKAKEDAISFAPFVQAFCDVFLKNSSLGKIKALKKHAAANPFIYRRELSFFRKDFRKKRRRHASKAENAQLTNVTG
ncbi:unnamed protein product [Cuscuta epithymum]|uniref:Uncharacterized protein n=1 Tax=Cuscuta epithymum TaxID=186058 RepID=A0AAV0CAK9_9ASTE|nr:unnamed protein product [Cuscuta epithymum]